MASSRPHLVPSLLAEGPPLLHRERSARHQSGGVRYHVKTACDDRLRI